MILSLIESFENLLFKSLMNHHLALKDKPEENNHE